MFPYTNKIECTEEITSITFDEMQENLEIAFSHMYNMFKSFKNIIEKIIPEDLDVLYKKIHEDTATIREITKYLSEYRYRINTTLHINTTIQTTFVSKALKTDNNTRCIEYQLNSYITTMEPILDLLIRKSEALSSRHSDPKKFACIKLHCKSYSMLCLLLDQYISMLCNCKPNDKYISIYKYASFMNSIILKIRHIETHYECSYGDTYIQEFVYQDKQTFDI
ncbi:MAG: hypothetical protein ACRCXT_00590 [Paraclostridium sp.]